jgi:hypothetical protein
MIYHRTGAKHMDKQCLWEIEDKFLGADIGISQLLFSWWL